MIATIHQPAYFPWVIYFQRIADSDIHVVLDNVQYEKNSFINRNKIRSSNSWFWLTVPIKHDKPLAELMIHEVQIDGNHWQKKHWKSLYQQYHTAPYFKKYADYFEDFYKKEWKNLIDLCLDSMSFFLKELHISTPIVRSSEMALTQKKSSLVLEICEMNSVTHYISGEYGKDYLDTDAFERSGVAVEYRDYPLKPYPQHHGGFEYAMAIVDLLFNCGPHARNILELE